MDPSLLAKLNAIPKSMNGDQSDKTDPNLVWTA